MQNRQDIINLLRELMPELRAEYGVKSLGIFGSFAADQANPQSDLDLLVDFDKPSGLQFIELAEKLEELVKRPVDLLTPGGIIGIRQPEIANNIMDNVIYV